MDAALRNDQPNANRWDFAIAYEHRNSTAEFIYWVEVHTAENSEIKVVLKKVKWLLGWLSSGGNPLDEFEREIVWVSSGATSFTLSSTQQKQMAAAGLRHAGRTLRIRNQRE